MQIDTATIIAIAALLISVLGPVLTGFFALRQTNKQNEHALKLALDDRKERSQQEEKMYYIQLVNSIIEAKVQYDSDLASGFSRNLIVKRKIQALMRSIPDDEIQKALKSSDDIEEVYIQAITRLGVMIGELMKT